MHDPVEQELPIEHGCETIKESTPSILVKCSYTQFYAWQRFKPTFFLKDTDSLDSLKGHFECYCSHASALSILVLKNVSPHHHACHAEHFFQLLPANFVVKLQTWKQWEKKLLHTQHQKRIDLNCSLTKTKSYCDHWILLFFSCICSYFSCNRSFLIYKNKGDLKKNKKKKSHISNKDCTANSASLQTMDYLIGDVGVAQQTGGDIDHRSIWSRTHPIHVHTIHSTHTTHSSMGPWRASATLCLVDFPLSNDTIRVLTKKEELIRHKWHLHFAQHTKIC